LLKTAIATCSVHDAPEFASWLIERFPSALPEIRQDVFGAIRNNPKRLEMMVEWIESGRLSTRNFDASQIQSLSGVRDDAIAARLDKVLSGAINTNRRTRTTARRFLRRIVRLATNWTGWELSLVQTFRTRGSSRLRNC
jgi:hypothetical protein